VTTALTSTTSGWTTSRRANASSWGPLGGQADLLEIGARGVALLLVPGRWRGVEVLGDERRVVDDHREQVVEVVGDAAREFTEALQAPRVVELVQQVLLLRFGLQALVLPEDRDALADVADRGRRQNLAVDLDARQADLGRELAAVPPAPDQLQLDTHRPLAGGGEEACPAEAVLLGEALGYQHLHRLADQLLAPISEQSLRLRVR
jgi:hypothetical protein